MSGEDWPCIGLDPDTDPCPFCGATMSDECGVSGGAWRIDPAHSHHIERWGGTDWVNDCWLPTDENALQWLAENIKEARENERADDAF